jgi:amidase
VQTPILHLHPGDRVTTKTIDAHGFDQHGEKLVDHSNPLVGPFFIEGLEPGDALVVTLEQIAPNRKNGWSYTSPLPWTVEARYVPHLPNREIIQWNVDLTRSTASPATDHPLLRNIHLPLSPMLGCIGVAPPLQQALTSYTMGEFGGNLDCPLLIQGSKIELPVFVPGGLLYLGDCHAVQCDGEIVGTGIEISSDVTFSVDIKKSSSILCPHGEDQEFFFTLGTGRPLDWALQNATAEMHRWLMTDFELDAEAASILLSHTIKYRVGSVVSPNYSIACCMPKTVLAMIGRHS